MRVAVEPGIVLEDGLALARAAGWEWTEASMARVVAMQPEGAFTARAEDGSTAGIVTCVLWDELAWIGGMLVDARWRRQGVARALLSHALTFAEERGARSVGLDATSEARPLYEREGFVAVGESARWARRGPIRTGPAAPSGDFAVYPVSLAEIMELVQYDAPRFGAGRGRLLAALMAERPHQAFVAVSRKTGAFSGHALALDGRVGPLVADEPAAADWLLHALERSGVEPRAIVPSWNADAERLFAAAGYEKGRACVRMVRGAPLPGRPQATYAVGAWALG